ncbi:MAG: hypothetical protein GY772_01395 [bacterium]|nr:hypothetical protein [bacterium]
MLGPHERAAWDPTRRVSVQRAHRLMAQLRAEMGGDPRVNPGGIVEAVRDLTEEAWVLDYICSRPDCAHLVEKGVTEVQGRFFGTRDSNLQQRRFDLMLLYEDGTAARIHPSQGSHGVPVFGNPATWFEPTEDDAAPAATRGAVALQRAPHGFEGWHQGDTVSRRRACYWLQDALDAWSALPHPRPPLLPPALRRRRLRVDAVLGLYAVGPRLGPQRPGV